MSMIKPLAIASVAVFLCVGQAEAGQKMSSGALKRLFPGNFTAVVHGYKLRISARSNGKLVGKYMTKTDTGRWSVRNGRLCIMLKVWMSGRTECNHVVRAGGWYKTPKVAFRKL